MNPTSTSLIRCLRKLAAPESCLDETDPQLLERFLTQRSEAAFAALVQRHGPMVLNVCRRVLNHVHDAEDAFQATFLLLARKAGSIRKHESVGSWLHGVAFRVSRMCRDKEARRRAYQRRMPPPQSVNVGDDIHWRELRSLLDEELGKMPEKYRAPLVLCYLEGRTRDEASRQLGVSQAVFRRRLEQGRDRLGRQLSRRGLTLSAALSAPLLADAATQAALPPLLAAGTVRAGVAAALGQATDTLVSAQVVALADGGVGSLLAKKASLIVALFVSLTLGLGGLLSQRAVHRLALTEIPAPPKATSSEPTPSLPQPAPADKDKAIDIKGRVLDPDGKPIAGAKVYVSTYSPKDKTDPKIRAASDSDGRFRFVAQRSEVDFEETVAAVAPGYGPDWAPLKEASNGSELTLRLVKDDVPINGRVLDLEGRPIAAATVRLIRVGKLPSEAVAAGLKELLVNPNNRNVFLRLYGRYERLLSWVWGVRGVSQSTKTGADGRFQLRGIGRDRIVVLRMEGPGIEYRTIVAITRPDLGQWPWLSLSKWLAVDIHGPTFDHLAAPSKPIRGIVREKDSGKPIAGIAVGFFDLYNGMREEVEAITDKDGRYEIPGIRKSERYDIKAGRRNSPYIRCWKTAGDTPGLQPVTVNFEMERGLVFRIRVTEKDTGKPVQGDVEYHVRLDNPNLSRVKTFPLDLTIREPIEKDGMCERVVLPGPGYIAFRAAKGPYARARPKGRGQDRFLLDVNARPLLEFHHAVVPINPTADDALSRTCPIVLERGRTLSGTVVDPQGRPLSGTMVCGLNAVMSLASTREEDERLTTPNFTVTGLDAKYPRKLVFHHAKRKLAKTLVLRGEEKGPVTVRLEPLGAVTGRCVNANGKPLSGTAISLLFEEIEDRQEKALPAEAILRSEPFRKALPPNETTTDKDGRFRIEGRIADLNYDLGIGREDKDVQRVRKVMASKPGATVDVGEIKIDAPTERE